MNCQHTFSSSIDTCDIKRNKFTNKDTQRKYNSDIISLIFYMKMIVIKNDYHIYFDIIKYRDHKPILHSGVLVILNAEEFVDPCDCYSVHH